MEMQTEQRLSACRNVALFAVHTDIAALANERWAVSQIKLTAGQTWMLRSESWKLDVLLAGGIIRKTAAVRAARADILIIAASSLEQRNESLIHWLNSVAAATNITAPRLLIGLLGSPDAKATELDWNVKQLLQCARTMNGEFIWLWMGNDTVIDGDSLTEDVANHLAALRSFGPAMAVH